jgi:hypothetical protein
VPILQTFAREDAAVGHATANRHSRLRQPIEGSKTTIRGIL